jgi:hypothetical protein
MPEPTTWDQNALKNHDGFQPMLKNPNSCCDALVALRLKNLKDNDDPLSEQEQGEPSTTAGGPHSILTSKHGASDGRA